MKSFAFAIFMLSITLTTVYAQSADIETTRRLAAQGNIKAQEDLGDFYFKAGNYLLAYVWYSSAEAQADEVVKDAYGYTVYVTETKLAPEQLAKAKEMAKRCIDSGYKQCE